MIGTITMAAAGMIPVLASLIMVSCASPKETWLSEPEFGGVRLKTHHWVVSPAGTQVDLGGGLWSSVGEDLVWLFMEIDVLPTGRGGSIFTAGFVVLSKNGAEIEKMDILVTDKTGDLSKNTAAGVVTTFHLSGVLDPDVVRKSEPLTVRHVRVSGWALPVSPLGDLSRLTKIDPGKRPLPR